MKSLPKMMLGFVVRRCTVDLGREPNAAEFAEWANNYGSEHESFCLFGRAISEDEARLILKHRARLVTARSASATEEYDEETIAAVASNVFSLANARARKNAAPRNGRNPQARRS